MEEARSSLNFEHTSPKYFNLIFWFLNIKILQKNDS